MNRTIITAGIASVLVLGACSTEPKTTAERAEMSSHVNSSLTRFTSADPSLQEHLDRAVGYAVFPEVKKAGVIVGGSYGRGELYEHGMRVGYCDITQGTIGAQLGAEAYSELIVFKDPEPLAKFKSGEFAVSVNASAVAIESGAAAHAQYRDGVAVFVLTKGGLMAEASVGGQKFSYTPDRGYTTGE